MVRGGGGKTYSFLKFYQFLQLVLLVTHRAGHCLNLNDSGFRFLVSLYGSEQSLIQIFFRRQRQRSLQGLDGVIFGLNSLNVTFNSMNLLFFMNLL